MASVNSFGAFVDFPCINLKGGVPGLSRLKNCPKLFLQATQAVLHKDCDAIDIFFNKYKAGDESFRRHLAMFLGEEYGNPVDKDCVMMTAGATHGLLVSLTLLISASSPIYVIDPSYYLGLRFIQDELSHNLVIAAPSDSEGPLIDELEKLITTHQPTAAVPEVVATAQQNGGGHQSGGTTPAGPSSSKDANRPYDGAVYLIPTFNNPRGTSYTPGEHYKLAGGYRAVHKVTEGVMKWECSRSLVEKDEECRKLVALARKYNLLLLADDVYNLVYFTDKADQPKRLLTYDLPSDPDYDGKGHVLSNGSFSKILAPGVRLGWIEGPQGIVRRISKSMLAISGGAFNQYVGKLVTELMRSGKLKEHLNCLRHDYKSAMTALCEVLDQGMPKNCAFSRPEGGFFVWLRLHPDVSAVEFLEYCQEKYQVIFLPGVRASLSNSYTNYVRLATSLVDEATLVDGSKKLCKAYKEFVAFMGIDGKKDLTEASIEVFKRRTQLFRQDLKKL